MLMLLAIKIQQGNSIMCIMHGGRALMFMYRSGRQLHQELYRRKE